MEFVQIQHPDIEGTGRVPVSAVAHWQSLGWEVFSAEPEVKPEVKEPEPKPARESRPASRRRNTEE